MGGIILALVSAWAVIFMVTEIRCAQRGWDTWDWAKKLYARSPLLQRIRW